MTAVADAGRIGTLVDGLRSAYVRILPPGEVTRPIGSAQNLIDGLRTSGVTSFDIAGDGESITFGVRGSDMEGLVSQLEEHYPQAELQIAPCDPLRQGEDERAFTAVRIVSGPEPVPISTFEDAEVSEEGSDPLLKVMAAFKKLEDGERALVRLVARPKRRKHFSKYAQDARTGPGSANETRRTAELAPKSSGSVGGLGLRYGILITVLGCLAIAFLVAAIRGIGFEEVRAFVSGITEEQLRTVVGTVGVVVLTASVLFLVLLIGMLFGLFGSKGGYYDSEVVADRVDHSPFDVEIQIIAFVRDSEYWKSRTREIVDHIAGEYSSYDRSRGSRVVRHKYIDGLPGDALELVSKRRLLRIFPTFVRSVAGSLELAALWHLPATRVRPASVERTTSRRWPVHSRFISEGAPVGVTTAGAQRVVHLGPAAMGSHQFYVAGSNMGKSTLMTHVVRHAMRQKALGEYPGAIVVVDPHGDLISDLLGLVPPEIAHRVRLIDLADESRVVGVNLLSPDFSPDRDVTADLLVNVFSRHWEFWGPNMSDILSHSIQTLYEANAHEDAVPEEAYTLLDAGQLWSSESFRRKVLERVKDANLHRYWLEDFPVYERGDPAQTLNPIRNRLRSYADSRVASAIIGQRFSTVDLKACVQRGNIIFISTGGQSVGKQVARLLGAYFLAMIDHIIRSQGELARDERQRVMVVVDEMQTIEGVPYGSMLEEWRKFGGALVLATQSLAQVRRLSPGLESSLLTNVGVLAAFKVDGDDGRKLAENLALVTKDDIVGLPKYNAYVRLSTYEETVPAFSMKILPPVTGNEAVADDIRRRSARYTQDIDAVYRRQQEETFRAIGMNAAASEKRRRRR